jgi:pimeloyl-ACP methyl ester carboxylesterase
VHLLRDALPQAHGGKVCGLRETPLTRQPFYPFRSERAKADYETHCLERAKTWPVPSEAVLLDTPSGRTFVRSSGRATDPPLVLLPGARVGSLMWTETIAALSARHRTHALDIIGDVGFSVNRGKISKPADHVDWLDEVLTVLVPKGPLSLTGLSLGGSIAAQYALRFPGRLRSLVLLAPGGTVLPFSLGFFVRLTLLSLPIPGRSGSPLRRMCRWLFEDAVRGDDAGRARVEQTIGELQTGMRSFALPRPPWPALVADEEWRGLRVPCLFLVGENEKIYSAKAAVRRLNQFAPQVKTEVLPGAGHDLMMVNPDLVTGRVLEFLAEREGVGAAVVA